MRVVSALTVLMCGACTAGAAPTSPIPFGPGSTIHWVSASDGNSDRFYERMIAEQGDLQIFQTVSDWPAGDASDFFALFSGVYFVSCDQDMPSAEERAKIAALWPLTEGAVVDVSTGDGATFEVKTPLEFFLMGKWFPAHVVGGKYHGDEESEEDLVILDDVPITVRIDWEDGGRDTATLITRPPAVAAPLEDSGLIGNCATLLN